MSESNITGGGRMKLSVAQVAAARWFREHGGDGVLLRGNIVLAAGEIAPHEWRTFKALEAVGVVERYGNRRIRIINGDEQ